MLFRSGSFRPDANITRAEFIAMVNRMTGRAPEHPEDIDHDWMITWTDNPVDKWYYLDVQEATNSHGYERKGTRANGRSFNYERWTEPLPPRDWSELESN